MKNTPCYYQKLEAKLKKFAHNWNNTVLQTFTSAKFWIAGANWLHFWKQVTLLSNAANF